MVWVGLSIKKIVGKGDSEAEDQAKSFIGKTKEFGVDESGEAFERVFKKIVPG